MLFRSFKNSDGCLDSLCEIPRLISESVTDKQFATDIVELLLDAMPDVGVVAIIQFDSSADYDAPEPKLMRWNCRNDSVKRFKPSRRLMAKVLQRRCSAIHLWDESQATPGYTMSGDLDWAFCTPIPTNQDRWCLYVSGRRSFDGIEATVRERGQVLPERVEEDLPKLVELKKEFGAALLVDDAHAIGVIGDTGAGTAEHWGVTEDVDLILGTFSKSFASIGGFCAGESIVIDYLRNHARALIFSASMPPANVAAVRTALEIMKREPERIEELWENTRRMKMGLQNLGFDTGCSETPVLPIRVGDTVNSFSACMYLQEEGVFVNPVVPPAVPEGDCLIRISLMANHTFDHIDFSLSKLEKMGRKFGVI